MKTLTILGTRPEAIKLAPVIEALEREPEIVSRVCVTAQHRELLDPLLELFDIKPDYDLDLMRPDQCLVELAADALKALKGVIEAERPDWVIVQGDTTTALAAALCAYYLGVSVAHVEAGLRSGNRYKPFPEEMDRRLIDHLSDLCFAPTERAAKNLLGEGISPARVHITGNTVVDVLFKVIRHPRFCEAELPINLSGDKRLILVTGHRRESFGPPLEQICRAVAKLAEKNKDVEIVFPVHLNPKVQRQVYLLLGGVERVHLIGPVLDYFSFVKLMEHSYLILTDSGGIQEEAPSLGKPVLIMRDATERPEVVELGLAKLVGTSAESIAYEAQRLLDDPEAYEAMCAGISPYGDGRAAERIISVLKAQWHPA